ncbi:unnamed protein product (macronuclear) [Paramecium tetraurelia]|uniref:Transmembrane protein n=1 Tax=Paramecium tetraurelia TaxID=5888 RepID=A0CHQ7_PARTE|nr:uncharacterized protein GSPATT00038426001 [Paramecium tetraurelia]CAK70324.1 unnamed protein product [Paramecium tetraurelia]|eukprot:XP_001437721.1 hypothetical protein (macronuclear) [Paramecium tetraurelia strain d4-2]
MFKLICLFVFTLAGCNCKCNQNEYDPAICILQITDSKCLYDEFLNQCIETSNQNLGCSHYLNRNACINQLTISGNVEKRCIFQNRCIDVNIYHLKNLGCSDSFSKYACINVVNKDCFWNGSQCEDSQKIIFSDNSKEEIYPYSVTPQLCAKYHKYPCINTGPQGDYKCVIINQIQFKELKCSTLGLNEIGCVSILTRNEMCLFENNQCKTINPSQMIECSQKINKLACLSITTPNLLCQWQQNECRVYKFDQQVTCLDIVDVNINVCANQEGLCMFDQLNYKCTQLNQKQLEYLNCDTPGITKFACLSIQNQYCTFNQGFCQTLSENDLSNYQCQMQLNQAACINIKTKGQLCLWNGQGCQNVEITQDQDCNNFDRFLVNGNVCQAIKKPYAMCKYDEITKICVKSSTNDYCTTPYLNLYGCVSISRENQTCKWIDSSC